MAFDISTAKPVGSAGKFDISSAKPVQSTPIVGEIPEAPSALQNLGDELSGLVRGAGSIGNTLLTGNEKINEHPASLLTMPMPLAAASKMLSMFSREDQPERTVADLIKEKTPVSNYERRARDMDSALRNLGANPDSGFFKGGKIAGEIAGTSGVGGAIAAPIKAASEAYPILAPLATSIESGGVANLSSKGLVEALKNASIRTTGGAITGGVGAGLIDPSQIKTGAAIGGALPVPLRALGATASGANSLIAPLFEKGQKYTLGNMLRDFSHNPEIANASLQAAPKTFPSGALQTTAEASGDIGLAGLTRGMQSSNPEFGNNLASRFYDQNNIRTQMLDDISGNQGKIAAAKSDRDIATSEMREKALDSAGSIPAQSIDDQIQSLLMNPNNAGKISQQALNTVRSQVRDFTDQSGAISARALYAIRKDINDIIGGKLQGEAGNLRHASGQLSEVKNIFDNHIEQAIGAPSSSREIVPYQQNKSIGPLGAPKEDAPVSFKNYLKTYSEMSRPISQMETLQDVFKKIQNGTPDNQGNMLLSGAKLNNLLKNEGDDLGKNLSQDQMDRLRALSAELNASTLGISSGKSIGSNTAQNYIIDRAINETLGKVGLGELGKNTLGGIGKAVYSRANDSLMKKLGEALLDPEMAAKLMTESKNGSASARALAEAIKNSSRAAPLLPAVNDK